MKRLFALLTAVMLILTLTGCERNPYEGAENPIATITLADGTVMRFELHLEAAPNTVANFTFLANDGFYDGLEFFRVVPGVLAQAGCPSNDGTGGTGYTIKGEFAQNGVTNDLSHSPGTLSMARLGGNQYNSASSQFFILSANVPEYDGQYAAFGTALDDDTLTAIRQLTSQRVDSYSVPMTRQKIASIRVNDHGMNLDPKIIVQD